MVVVWLAHVRWVDVALPLPWRREEAWRPLALPRDSRAVRVESRLGHAAAAHATHPAATSAPRAVIWAQQHSAVTAAHPAHAAAEAG
eukprot:CAMPEP_0182539086 /NCGR_PEP_ID=MMETSP1323-20130603/24787_1 /TAXON_ID=236787 /ORGANISM="Florenciella parvula, Strain RCC1693" /LENGTH=86 /DNA_ID=CAMNT_0024749613 /DNA_START=249 /DNA_END=505 /DNA_ORIENTATION=-